ncbi:MAG: hypothetical protein CMJ66_07250 [Planctomycetaceae bacterium]|nr:hypothetical protein [Planctomycetaceae bacterium]
MAPNRISHPKSSKRGLFFPEKSHLREHSVDFFQAFINVMESGDYNALFIVLTMKHVQKT